MAVDDNTCSGDPPCWAHLFEDSNGEEAGEAVDLMALAGAAAGRGPAWSRRSDDLDINLIVFCLGEGVDEHRNDDLDVLLVGVTGAGVVTIDGQPQPLTGGQALLVPKGACRSIRAYTDRFAYLTCHRRRAGLWPTRTTT